MRNLYDRDSIKVDLHLHTTASDGTWGPERLVGELVEKGISIFSVTDHNSIDNVKIISALAEASNLTIIPGVEVDVSYNSRSYHMLGYGIDIENQALLLILKMNRELMEEKDDESIQYLEDSGFNVSLEDYKSYVNDVEKGGWKALNYLIDRGFCTGPSDFFKLFTSYGNPFDKMTFVSPGDAAEAIRAAGGIPVLAHPGASFYGGDFKSVVKLMMENGVMGIECFHPENSSEITDYCLDVCNKNNLLITGGSDCHGLFVPKRRIGLPDIRLGQLKIPELLE